MFSNEILICDQSDDEVCISGCALTRLCRVCLLRLILDLGEVCKVQGWTKWRKESDVCMVCWLTRKYTKCGLDKMIILEGFIYSII